MHGFTATRPGARPRRHGATPAGRCPSACRACRTARRWPPTARPASRPSSRRRSWGIYQGLIPQCAFPDAGSTAQQIVDYEALGNYFTAADKANPLDWLPTQEAEVDGTAIENVPALDFDATFSTSAFFPFAVPNNCTDYSPAAAKDVPASEVYNPISNPGGVRCGLLDWDINLLGPQPPSEWTAAEQAAGHGFAAVPISNIGVQYGLSALEHGQISPAQFADLNVKIGSFNVDFQPVAARLPADQPALGRAYRTGFINEANNLNQVAIIDVMGLNDPGPAHDTVRAFALRARLQQNFGTTANMAIWQGPVPLLGDVDFTGMAFRAMTAGSDRSRPITASARCRRRSSPTSRPTFTTSARTAPAP
jgi:hypothetical protein